MSGFAAVEGCRWDLFLSASPEVRISQVHLTKRISQKTFHVWQTNINNTFGKMMVLEEWMQLMEVES